MGELVLAAKVSHVPSLMLSEVAGSPLKAARQGAVDALRELGRRARERRRLDLRGVRHALAVQFRLSHQRQSAPSRRLHQPRSPADDSGSALRPAGRPARSPKRLRRRPAGAGLNVIAHKVASLGLEYGTIVPMHYMNADGWAKVVSVATPLFTSLEESRILGEATRRAIAQSGERVAILASGSLSHRLWPNKKLGPEAWTSIASEFNRQVDLRVLELWQQRRYREFIDMLPDYAIKCNGEGGMADTIMLFAALGWDGYQRRGRAALRLFSVQRQRPGQCRVSRRRMIFGSRGDVGIATPISPMASARGHR